MKHVICDHCEQPFTMSTSQYNQSNKRGHKKYCSLDCSGKGRNTYVTVPCGSCHKEVTAPVKQLNASKSSHLFCNHSCSITYHNLHKTKGTRRSKLEVWLEEQLATLYPNLEILYCDKQAINGELDIYVPSFRLAFELNGIYHYEPIHGQSKLDQVQSNDHRKFQACIEHGIELVIMDTSQLKYFKLIHCQKYLDIITGIINSKLQSADPGWAVSK